MGHTFSAVSKVAYINFSFFPPFFVGSKREIVEPICFFSSYTVSIAAPSQYHALNAKHAIAEKTHVTIDRDDRVKWKQKKID